MSNIQPFFIKRNDTARSYQHEIILEDRQPFNVSSATIRTNMIHVDSGTVVVSRQTAGISFIGSGDDATQGIFSYTFQSSDTALSGTYKIEFEIELIAGGKFTSPTGKNKAIVIISDDFDNV